MLQILLFITNQSDTAVLRQVAWRSWESDSKALGLMSGPLWNSLWQSLNFKTLIPLPHRAFALAESTVAAWAGGYQAF